MVRPRTIASVVLATVVAASATGGCSAGSSSKDDKSVTATTYSIATVPETTTTVVESAAVKSARLVCAAMNTASAVKMVDEGPIEIPESLRTSDGAVNSRQCSLVNGAINVVVEESTYADRAAASSAYDRRRVSDYSQGASLLDLGDQALLHSSNKRYADVVVRTGTRLIHVSTISGIDNDADVAELERFARAVVPLLG
jgi:hypothetical protein